MTLSIHKGYLPGAIGRIVELHARYYSGLVGFGLPFESKVARELVEFCERYDSERDGLWLALQDGQIEGAIAMDGSPAEQDGAHLPEAGSKIIVLLTGDVRAAFVRRCLRLKPSVGAERFSTFWGQHDGCR